MRCKGISVFILTKDNLSSYSLLRLCKCNRLFYKLYLQHSIRKSLANKLLLIAGMYIIVGIVVFFFIWYMKQQPILDNRRRYIGIATQFIYSFSSDIIFRKYTILFQFICSVFVMVSHEND